MEKTTSSKRSIIYVRVVSDSHKMEENHAQRVNCELYSKEQGYELVGVYEDTGSGLSMDRPAMNRLIEDAAAGKFDTIVVYDISRIARNTIAVRAFLDEMQQCGVTVESVKEPKGVIALCHQ